MLCCIIPDNNFCAKKFYVRSELVWKIMILEELFVLRSLYFVNIFILDFNTYVSMYQIGDIFRVWLVFSLKFYTFSIWCLCMLKWLYIKNRAKLFMFITYKPQKGWNNKTPALYDYDLTLDFCLINDTFFVSMNAYFF